MRTVSIVIVIIVMLFAGVAREDAQKCSETADPDAALVH
jgi:hypothetical protein